jgi:hypothetical protein
LGHGKEPLPAGEDGAPDATAAEGEIHQGGDGAPGLKGLSFHPGPGPGDMHAPPCAQGMAVIRFSEEKSGKTVQVHLDPGAIGKTASFFPGAGEKIGRLSPVGAKIGAKVNAGAAAAAQFRLNDPLGEFICSEIIHDKTSFFILF